MAETTERPHEAGEYPSGATAGTAAAASESYRPLSLLALAGFGVAVLYTLAVLVGGSAALLNRVPWLMPTWTFFIPVAALTLCALARRRIRNAEETLSGLAFTTWGLRLTIVVGLTYLAYYGFTFFAVRLHAVDCANQFFEQIKQGDIERAFLLGMGVSTQDLNDAEVHDMVQGRFNNPQGPSSTGPFTTFSQGPMVRGIQSSGGEARFVPMGVLDWDYSGGGYHVQLKYQIYTALAEFEAVVSVFGQDAKPGETKGRQWQVEIKKGETHIVLSSQRLTARGEDFSRNVTMALALAHAWMEKVQRRQWAEAYLDTQPLAERQRLRQAVHLRETAPVAGLAAASLDTPALRVYQAGLQAFLDGKIIRLEEKNFWTIKRDREAILQHVRETFRPKADGEPLFVLRLQQIKAPLVRFAEGQISFLMDCNLSYSEETGAPPSYVVEGYLVLSAEETQAESSPGAWWVDGIEVTSGRTPPKTPEMRRQMGVAGQAGPRGGP